MKIIGTPDLKLALAHPGSSLKCVFNETGAIFFPSTQEHREARAPGIFYEHDHKGNALAAILTPGKFEIRFHEHFRPERVVNMMKTLLADPAMAFAVGFKVTYQGKILPGSPLPKPLES
jgi:hypothetical protein